MKSTPSPVRGIAVRSWLADWLPLVVLLAIAFSLINVLPRWGFMWALAFAIFFGFKWLSWYRCTIKPAALWKNLAYLFAWVGMDVNEFLSDRVAVPKPGATAWVAAALKTILGGVLLWGVARLAPESNTFLRGWIGMFGFIFLLHFGAFHLLALAWQYFGVNARLLMDKPILATSLSDFWGNRWNSAFNRLAYDLIFRPLRRPVGTAVATMIVFVVSGLVHDLLISVPAGGGYGLPTVYFIIQGIGLLLERSTFGRRAGLRHGATGRAFALLVTGLPAVILFHPPFINRVILPFMKVLHAI